MDEVYEINRIEIIMLMLEFSREKTNLNSNKNTRIIGELINLSKGLVNEKRKGTNLGLFRDDNETTR